jgi:hypothetical protein
MTSATSWPERVRASARRTSFYWTDDGNLAGLRYDRSKLVFMEQRAEGLAVWENPLISLRFPKLCDLRADRSKRRRRMPAIRQVARRAGVRTRPRAGLRGPAPEDLLKDNRRRSRAPFARGEQWIGTRSVLHCRPGSPRETIHRARNKEEALQGIGQSKLRSCAGKKSFWATTGTIVRTTNDSSSLSLNGTTGCMLVVTLDPSRVGPILKSKLD